MGQKNTSTGVIGILLVLVILQVKQNVGIICSHGRSGYTVSGIPNYKNVVDGVISTNPFSAVTLLGTSTFLFYDQSNLPHLVHLSIIREGFEKITSSARSRPRQKRQMYKSISKWENRTMYYYYDADFEEDRRVYVEKAMNYIRARTCIDFVENTTANHRALIFKGEGCVYYNGEPQEGLKNISLGPECADFRGCISCQSFFYYLPNLNKTYNFKDFEGSSSMTVAPALHEIIHALGGIHIQSHIDRDDYVRVDLSLAQENETDQFEKFPADELIKYVPYDYGSIMHYGAVDLQAIYPSNGSHVITPLDKRYLATIGSEIPSFYDIMLINKHYNCSDNCRFSKRITCANGGVPNPRKCDECLCPYGYGGRFCDKRPAGCGDILKAKYHWKTKTFGFDNPRTKLNDEQEYAMCNYWIVAPPGKFIQIRVTALSDECYYGCTSNAIEPKILKDKRTTSPRICCKNQLNELLTSKLNPTPIFSYAKGNPHFTFQYRCTDV